MHALRPEIVEPFRASVGFDHSVVPATEELGDDKRSPMSKLAVQLKEGLYPTPECSYAG